MMNKSVFKLVVLVPLGFALAPAHANTSLSVAAIGNVADGRVPEQIEAGSGVSIEADRRFSYGVGVLVGSQVASTVGVETGALLINRRFQYGSDSFNFTQSQCQLQIPILARLSLGQIFSIGAGPFVSFPMGGVRNSYTIGNSTSTPFEIDRKVTELGLQAAASFALPIAPATHIFLEGRYAYGMTALNSDDGTYANTNDLSTLLGLRMTL